MSRHGEGDFVARCTCSQCNDGDDSQSVDTLIVEGIGDELQANKIERLNSFLSDVCRYDTVKKGHRDLVYLSMIITLSIIILVSIFFWKHQHSNKAIVAISLYGNGQLQVGRAGSPFHSWKCLFKYGNIDLVEGKKIVIRRSGLYHLYAQMFFFYNTMRSLRNFTANPVMDFGITRAQTYERLIGTSVSIHYCRVACTRYVAGIIPLQKGDILTLDTSTPGVYFKMLKGKTFFAAYLLNDV